LCHFTGQTRNLARPCCKRRQVPVNALYENSTLRRATLSFAVIGDDFLRAHCLGETFVKNVVLQDGWGVGAGMIGVQEMVRAEMIIGYSFSRRYIPLGKFVYLAVVVFPAQPE